MHMRRRGGGCVLVLAIVSAASAACTDAAPEDSPAGFDPGEQSTPGASSGDDTPSLPDRDVGGDPIDRPDPGPSEDPEVEIESSFRAPVSFGLICPVR